MNMDQEYERPPSSISYSLSTTLTEEKEVPPLSISVTIKAQPIQKDSEEVEKNEKTEENAKTDENAKTKEKEQNYEVEEKGRSVKKLTSTINGTSLLINDKVEKVKQYGAKSYEDKRPQEVLPGWKGYSKNIYFQPIIVHSPHPEKFPCKDSARLRITKIDDIRRQMQIRQASDWVMKHNQRIHFKGSLKVGEFPSKTRARSLSNASRQSSSSQLSTTTTTSSTKSKSNGLRARSQLHCNKLPTNQKSKVVKGFVCRSWSRDYLPSPPETHSYMEEENSSLTIRSYINVSDPRWKACRSRHQKNVLEGSSPQTRYNDEIYENSVPDLQPTKQPGLKEKRSLSPEPSVTSGRTLLTDSVHLADLLFKSVSLNFHNSCTENDCQCSMKKLQDPTFPENLPRFETISKNMARVTGNTDSETKKFPPISPGHDSELKGSGEVQRPKRVNLTFASISSGTQCNSEKEVKNRSHSSSLSKSL